MLSKFFIDRPVFANVIAIITVILGLVAMFNLPVEQYPRITPPTVQVSTVYPGANARVVTDTVAAPIEQQVNGVEGMLYMSSNCSADGSYSLTVTFDIGVDLDTAQVLVQNRVAIAEPQLPEEVRRQGISVQKQSTDIILVISLTSPDKTFDSLFMANYATLRLRDELSRVSGVGGVDVRGGSDYSMRVWLDPEQLSARNLTTSDVIAALRDQNVQVAAGQIGQAPSPVSQLLQFPVTALGRLSDAEQFEGIIVKKQEGRVTYLRDVARVELGSQSYDSFSIRSGTAAVSILIFQLPGANALEVAKNVHTAIDRLSQDFPAGLEYSIPFDTTKFVAQGVEGVYRTLIEAGVLVLLVILVFLHDWRAVLVPATTVPVTIIGAFAVMPFFGFTINFLTLFGLVLAIGIVVDDAIIIVENAAHHVQRGLAPREAAIKAMEEMTGPVISITLVLSAVFLPAAFLGGVTGQLYRQFALTIAATAVLSAVNALTLKPVQCATYLRPLPEKRNAFVRGFDCVYHGIESLYVRLLRGFLRVSPVAMLLFFALIAGTAWWYFSLPTGFLPTEDQGYVLVSVQLPDGASQERTRAVVNKLDKLFADEPAIDNWLILGGMSILDRTMAPNAATAFAVFKDWGERRDPELEQQAIVDRLGRQLREIHEANIFALVPPAIRGLGSAGGFQIQVEDRAGVGREELGQRLQELIQAAAEHSELGPMQTTFRPGVPQLFVDVDRVKAQKMNLDLNDIYNTLQANLGSFYTNDFNKFGRTYQVRLQAEPRFRDDPEDIYRLRVRNSKGQMIPVGSVLTVNEAFGPQVIGRYNLYPTASIIGSSAPDRSSGEALAVMEQVARDVLPDTMGFDWTGMAYQEKLVGGQALYVFALAVLLVYLVLAAQYESWILPMAVILVVPIGMLGIVAAVWLRGMDNNVYTQIGTVLIIALASKNAILIVEFARELRIAGRSVLDAAVEASRLRFRPILMTSFAFMLGVVPLVWAHGAGAASQRSLGTAVFGGMATSTVLAVFFVPVFFVILQRVQEWWSGRNRGQQMDEQSEKSRTAPHWKFVRSRARRTESLSAPPLAREER
jgi:HAE1 family hydrophobic/amphiphilic exporter-1